MSILLTTYTYEEGRLFLNYIFKKKFPEDLVPFLRKYSETIVYDNYVIVKVKDFRGSLCGKKSSKDKVHYLLVSTQPFDEEHPYNFYESLFPGQLQCQDLPKSFATTEHYNDKTDEVRKAMKDLINKDESYYYEDIFQTDDSDFLGFCYAFQKEPEPPMKPFDYLGIPEVLRTFKINGDALSDSSEMSKNPKQIFQDNLKTLTTEMKFQTNVGCWCKMALNLAKRSLVTPHIYSQDTDEGKLFNTRKIESLAQNINDEGGPHTDTHTVETKETHVLPQDTDEGKLFDTRKIESLAQDADEDSAFKINETQSLSQDMSNENISHTIETNESEFELEDIDEDDLSIEPDGRHFRSKAYDIMKNEMRETNSFLKELKNQYRNLTKSSIPPEELGNQSVKSFTRPHSPPSEVETECENFSFRWSPSPVASENNSHDERGSPEIEDLTTIFKNLRYSGIEETHEFVPRDEEKKPTELSCEDLTLPSRENILFYAFFEDRKTEGIPSDDTKNVDFLEKFNEIRKASYETREIETYFYKLLTKSGCVYDSKVIYVSSTIDENFTIATSDKWKPYSSRKYDVVGDRQHLDNVLHSIYHQMLTNCCGSLSVLSLCKENCWSIDVSLIEGRNLMEILRHVSFNAVKESSNLPLGKDVKVTSEERDSSNEIEESLTNLSLIKYLMATLEKDSSDDEIEESSDLLLEKDLMGASTRMYDSSDEIEESSTNLSQDLIEVSKEDGKRKDPKKPINWEEARQYAFPAVSNLPDLKKNISDSEARNTENIKDITSIVPGSQLWSLRHCSEEVSRMSLGIFIEDSNVNYADIFEYISDTSSQTSDDEQESPNYADIFEVISDTSSLTSGVDQFQFSEIQMDTETTQDYSQLRNECEHDDLKDKIEHTQLEGDKDTFMKECEYDNLKDNKMEDTQLERHKDPIMKDIDEICEEKRNTEAVEKDTANAEKTDTDVTYLPKSKRRRLLEINLNAADIDFDEIWGEEKDTETLEEDTEYVEDSDTDSDNLCAQPTKRGRHQENIEKAADIDEICEEKRNTEAVEKDTANAEIDDFSSDIRESSKENRKKEKKYNSLKGMYEEIVKSFIKDISNIPHELHDPEILELRKQIPKLQRIANFTEKSIVGRDDIIKGLLSQPLKKYEKYNEDAGKKSANQCRNPPVNIDYTLLFQLGLLKK